MKPVILAFRLLLIYLFIYFSPGVKEKLCEKLLQNKTLPFTLPFRLPLSDKCHHQIQDKARHVALFYFRICPHHTSTSFCLLFLLILSRSRVFVWHELVLLGIGCCKSKSCEAVVLLIPCSVQGQQQMWPEALLLES